MFGVGLYQAECKESSPLILKLLCQLLEQDAGDDDSRYRIQCLVAEAGAVNLVVALITSVQEDFEIFRYSIRLGNALLDGWNEKNQVR